MKNFNFVQLQKENEEHYILLESLMILYNIEIDSHHDRKTPTELIREITRGMLNMQGDTDRHLELCYDEEKLIGFLYGKVDHVGHKEFIKPEYGYIMEFYVKPEFRRNGYGKVMYKQLEQLFASHGTKRMYLTADPVTGDPFWKAMGFENIGEVSPENGLLIYEKEVPDYTEPPHMKSTENLKAVRTNSESAELICNLYNQNIDKLHGNEISLAEWKRVFSVDDADEMHFLIHKGAMPVAWLKINGLMNDDIAWISMLAVEPCMQHQGIGTYAVNFAEEYIRSKGFSKVGIHTTDDNIVAQSLYKKCGYAITEHSECITGNGEKRMGYTFKKVLSSNISYVELSARDICNDMLSKFNRYQEISLTYRNDNGRYIVVSNPYTANWDNQRKQDVINDFLNDLIHGGNLFVACDGKEIIGFSLLGNKPLGSQHQYLQLIQLQVSCEYRSKGIGKRLFNLCVDAAKNKRYKKIYISANSAFESQAFYRAFGCIEACEIIQELFEQEPYDVHMEYGVEVVS